MNERKAIQAAKEFILSHYLKNCEGPASKQITIEIYWWQLDFGLRISEISFISRRADGGTAGASYMQSDLDSGPVIFAVERLVLEYLLDESEDDLDAEQYRVLYVMFGEEYADAWRSSKDD